MENAITHTTRCDWVTSADDATITARTNSEKCRDYYDSKQITADERASLTARNQAPVAMNRIKPKMDSLMGMEKAAKTTVKAYPRTPIHEKAAEASTEAIRFVLQDNHFDQVRSSAWEFILIEGTCGAEVIVKPRGKEFDVIINPLFWDRLIYDQHSRRKDFSDARWKGQVVWMDWDEAVARYPNGKDVLEEMNSSSSTYDDKPNWVDTVRRRVKIIEMYYQQGGEVWFSVFTRGGDLEEPKISPYKNEDGETEDPYEFASAFVGRQGDRYGATFQLLDVQDEINKRRSKALHLMSVRQTFGTPGAITDVNKFRQELAKPDGHAEVAYGEFGKDFGILPTGDMAQSQFHLLEEAKQEIDAVGVNAALMGKDNTAVSGKALMARQSAGQTEIGPLFDVLKYWQLRVFRKVWNRIRQYWKEEKWIRVTDDEQNLRWVGLNKPQTKGELVLKQAQEQGAPPEALAQLQQRIAQDPTMQEQVGKENDLAELDVDLIISEVPDVLTAQVEDFQTLGEMVKSGFPIPPLAVIEASPLSNKDKIVKMMKESPQLSPEQQKQMEGMQEAMKKMQEDGQKLQQENQSLKMGQQEAAAKLQARAEESKIKLELKKQEQDAEIQLARDKAHAEIELKRAVAEADYEIKQKELNQANEHKLKELKMTREFEAEKQVPVMQAEIMPQISKMVSDNEDKAMPKFVEALQDLTQAFTSVVQNQQQFQAQIVESLNQPRKMSIDHISRSDGKMTGASISVH